MKYRIGFVTNSSSSSFICCYCGSVYTGWDMSLSEAEMLECVNGHLLCEYHLGEELTVEKKKKIIQQKLEESIKHYTVQSENDDYAFKDWAKEELETSKKSLEKIKEADVDEDIIIDLFEELDIRHDLPDEYCPICTFEILNEEDALNYLMKKYEMKMKDLQREVKNKFASYKDFNEYLRG